MAFSRHINYGIFSVFIQLSRCNSLVNRKELTEQTFFTGWKTWLFVAFFGKITKVEK